MKELGLRCRSCQYLAHSCDWEGVTHCYNIMSFNAIAGRKCLLVRSIVAGEVICLYSGPKGTYSPLIKKDCMQADKFCHDPLSSSHVLFSLTMARHKISLKLLPCLENGDNNFQFCLSQKTAGRISVEMNVTTLANITTIIM